MFQLSFISHFLDHPPHTHTHTHTHTLTLFVVVVVIIGNINIPFNSNYVLKITDASRLSHKHECPAFSVLFYWRPEKRILDKLGKKEDLKKKQINRRIV